MDATQVLATLFSDNSVELGTGEKVAIKKTSLRTMKPALEFLARLLKDLNPDGKSSVTINMSDPSTLVQLISKYYDDVVALVVAHSSMDEEKFLDLGLDDSVLVLQGVVALNKDFFMTKVAPMLQMMTETLSEQPATPASSDSTAS